MIDKYNDTWYLIYLRDEYHNANDISDKFNIIRKLYDRFTPMILNGENLGISLLNWDFSPIELEAYNYIKSLCCLRVYPQYPVDRFFVDFGCPIRKIAIELDGKEFHDKDKDNKRDLILHDLGWKVFRIEGYKCFSKIYFDFDNPYDFEDICYNNLKWFNETLEGILTAISVIYFGEPGYYGYKEESAKVCLNHISTPYKI